ncbi:hypothetical protein [Cellulomonas timonensis]|uniref:hypothetical protein n=1 Tax=Cellulomonas timonensis TaxID=1689271 RepID=UPI000A6309E5|nr:hypothetical protein [Cellulomonas timonensis]
MPQPPISTTPQTSAPQSPTTTDRGLPPGGAAQGAAPPDRASVLAAARRARVDALVALAVRGLPAAVVPAPGLFAQTVRAVRGDAGVTLRAEGSNLRYAAIVALGLAGLPPAEQRAAHGSLTAAELAGQVVERAAAHRDPGAVALAAWAGAEAGGAWPTDGLGRLLERLHRLLDAGGPLPTVDTAWMLTAALAIERHGPDPVAAAVRAAARERLLAAQGPQGIFPHALPAASQGRLRAHVGCFADQVYPIQALARLAAAMPDEEALAAANRCAARICALQGVAGQWWWHYDARTGDVVEGYPVYSVHQHAMGPMALLDLREAGGDDHLASVERGLDWLDAHPEVLEDLVSERHALVWRKVGRRELAKAMRKIAAATTAVAPRLRLPGLARLMPPSVVDHECRPYELGWLVYAWRSTDRRSPDARTSEPATPRPEPR